MNQHYDARQVRRLVESATTPDNRHVITAEDDVYWLSSYIDQQQGQIRRLIGEMYDARQSAANWRGAFWGLVLVHALAFLAVLTGNVPMLRW